MLNCHGNHWGGGDQEVVTHVWLTCSSATWPIVFLMKPNMGLLSRHQEWMQNLRSFAALQEQSFVFFEFLFDSFSFFIIIFYFITVLTFHIFSLRNLCSSISIAHIICSLLILWTFFLWYVHHVSVCVFDHVFACLPWNSHCVCVWLREILCKYPVLLALKKYFTKN